MSDLKEKAIVGGAGAAAVTGAVGNVAYQIHREDTRSTRRQEKMAKEFQKKLDASTRKQNEIKVKNLQEKLKKLQSVKNKKPFNQSKFLGSNNKLKKDLNLQIKNLKNQISDLKPSNFIKGVKTAVKLGKAVTPISAFIAGMGFGQKTATDEQMKSEMEKMKNKSNKDYRKGGMLLSSVDNRKKR